MYPLTGLKILFPIANSDEKNHTINADLHNSWRYTQMYMGIARVFLLPFFVLVLTGASPSVKQGGLPPCRGTYNAELWTNCAGEVTTKSGGKYVGEFKDGKFNGQGTLTWPDGTNYVGSFKDSKFSGQGTYILANGQKYVGEFRDNKFNGQGTLTWHDGDKYVGKFRDDKPNGQGAYTWPDGRKNVGEYRDGRRNGQGTLTWPDGAKYVGEFKDDKFNGQGTEYRANGSILRSGTWENDVFVRRR